ncbi:MAG: hypothetical protein IMF06_10220 [Proteobacteria bacterium]|nr:hypothetical protein [Pseudomonadota bacterium]
MLKFWYEMRRRHVLRIAGIYFAVGWLLIEIMVSVLPEFDAPTWIAKTFIFVIVLMFPIALILAWAFEITPDGIKLASELDKLSSDPDKLPSAVPDYLIVLGLALVLVLGIYGYQTRNEAATTVTDAPATVSQAIPSVAILPFVDLGENGSNQYLGNGLAEEILNALADWDGLRIASRTSSFAVQNKNMDIQEIGERLGVKQILEGSLRRQGSRLKVTAHLTDVKTGFHSWSESYDREFEDIFEIEESLARAIVVALQGPLAVADNETVIKYQTANVDAYNLLLKGRYYFQSPTQENFGLALAAFQEAIELDPNYWTAHGYLAFSLGYASIYSDYASQVIQSATSTELALRHDPENVPANVIKGFMSEDIDQAYTYYNIALGQRGDRDLSIYVYVNAYLYPQQRQEEGRNLLLRGLKDDPSSLIISQSLAMTESRAGNYEQALDIIARAGDTDGSNFLVSSVQVDVYYRSRDIDRLRQAAEQSIEKIGIQNGFILQYLLQAHVLSGELERAKEILDDMLTIRERGGFMSATVVGMSLASLGRIDEAALWFVRAHRERDYWLRWHLKSATEDIPSLGEHPTIKILLVTMGLDDTSIAARIDQGR